MGNNPLISIIVPVYNAETCISQCLDSLVNQTYKRIEIICINDGSRDLSLNILEEYARKDSRIVVINQENKGISDARNTGIGTATGDYIMFIDSDDWTEEITCEIVMKFALKYEADVVMWSYMREFNNSSDPKEIFASDLCFDKNDVKEKLHRRLIGLVGEELSHPEVADAICPVWGKIYKRECIAENKFIDLKQIGTYEDGMFNMQVYENVSKVIYINSPMYHYRKTNSSSLTSTYKPDLFKCWQNLFEYMEQYIFERKLKNDYVIALNNRIALSILGLGLNILSSDFSMLKKVKLISEILNTERYCNAYKQLDYQYFPIYWKLFYKFAKYRCSIGVYILLCCIQKLRRR